MSPLRRIASLLLGLAVTLSALVVMSGTAAAKPRTADPTTATVTGTLADGTGAVAGTFDVTRFAVQGGELVAIGTFTGTVTDAAGTVTSDSQQITVPVDLAQSDGSCQILDLVLGPLDLDLLGLQVHLDQIELNITAQSGPGNLLGNLLCAVAGLLDAPANPVSALLQQIANLLNQILGILG